ncbi:MAG: hypothetical protein ACLTOP_01180 [Collinsella phocaeensis]|jgi:hypothetical protein
MGKNLQETHQTYCHLKHLIQEIRQSAAYRQHDYTCLRRRAQSSTGFITIELDNLPEQDSRGARMARTASQACPTGATRYLNSQPPEYRILPRPPPITRHEHQELMHSNLFAGCMDSFDPYAL